jgi:small-conductance mechanosensitive channel
VLVTGLALLVIWGRLDLATWLVVRIGQSMPDFAKMVLSLSLIAGAYVGTSLLGDQLRRFSERTDRLTKHQEEIVFRTIQLSTFVIAGLVVLGLWEVDLGALLAGAGFLGIVLGMAARQTLGSVIAGFVLMFARPFEIGDWVQIGDHEGIVTDISINNTRLENFDGEYVVISNDRVNDDVIINRTRKGRLRVRLEVGVDYATDLDHAEAVVLETVREIDELMTVPTPKVMPRRFGDSAIVLEVRFWVDKPSSRRRWRAIAEVVRAIKKAFDREGITIPFPQRELSGRAETGGFRVVDGAEPRSERTPPEA